MQCTSLSTIQCWKKTRILWFWQTSLYLWSFINSLYKLCKSDIFSCSFSCIWRFFRIFVPSRNCMTNLSSRNIMPIICPSEELTVFYKENTTWDILHLLFWWYFDNDFTKLSYHINVIWNDSVNLAYYLRTNQICTSLLLHQ